MQWAAFNELRNSSTRCEAGGARVAIQRDGPVHVGIDNQTTVTTCADITEHHRKRMEAKLKNESGGLILGGKTSPLHRKSQSRRPWSLVKNGDLWQSIEEAVLAKGPRSVRVTKVKGHATDEMVNEGRVKPEDKAGNDVADKAADKGAEQTDVIAVALGYVYAKKA